MKYKLVTLIGTISLAVFATGCSTQVQNDPRGQVTSQQGSQRQVESKPAVRTVVKRVTVKAKHCHTFKGYGWNKKVCHAHPAPHKHTKKAMRRSRYINRKPSRAHSHSGRRHSHPFTNPNHKHRKGTGKSRCQPCVARYR